MTSERGEDVPLTLVLHHWQVNIKFFFKAFHRIIHWSQELLSNLYFWEWVQEVNSANMYLSINCFQEQPPYHTPLESNVFWASTLEGNVHPRHFTSLLIPLAFSLPLFFSILFAGDQLPADDITLTSSCISVVTRTDVGVLEAPLTSSIFSPHLQSQRPENCWHLLSAFPS